MKSKKTVKNILDSWFECRRAEAEKHAPYSPKGYIAERTENISDFDVVEVRHLKNDLYIAKCVVWHSDKSAERKQYYVNTKTKTVDTCGYAIVEDKNTGLLIITSNDKLGLYEDTEKAVKQAKKDGFKLIPSKEVPKSGYRWGGYLDTQKNRELLASYSLFERITGCCYVTPAFMQ